MLRILVCVHRPSPPGLVRVLKLVEVLQTEFTRRGADPADEASQMTANAADSVHLKEVKQMVDLAKAFPGKFIHEALCELYAR